MKISEDIVRQFNESINSISPSECGKMIDQWCEAQHFANVADIAIGVKAVLGPDLSHTQPEVQYEATN